MQLNGFKYNKWLNSSIWLIDGILDQSEHGSNGNEGLFHISQSSKTKSSYPGQLL